MNRVVDFVRIDQVSSMAGCAESFFGISFFSGTLADLVRQTDINRSQWAVTAWKILCGYQQKGN